MNEVIIFASFFLIVIGSFIWVRIDDKLQRKRLNAIKKSSRFIELFSSDELKTFFNIPEEYRCNPFLYDSKGRMFFADRRNLDKIEKLEPI